MFRISLLKYKNRPPKGRIIPRYHPCNLVCVQAHHNSAGYVVKIKPNTRSPLTEGMPATPTGACALSAAVQGWIQQAASPRKAFSRDFPSLSGALLLLFPFTTVTCMVC